MIFSRSTCNIVYIGITYCVWFFFECACMFHAIGYEWLTCECDSDSLVGGGSSIGNDFRIWRPDAAAKYVLHIRSLRSIDGENGRQTDRPSVGMVAMQPDCCWKTNLENLFKKTAAGSSMLTLNKFRSVPACCLQRASIYCSSPWLSNGPNESAGWRQPDGAGGATETPTTTTRLSVRPSVKWTAE